MSLLLAGIWIAGRGGDSDGFLTLGGWAGHGLNYGLDCSPIPGRPPLSVDVREPLWPGMTAAAGTSTDALGPRSDNL